MFTVNRIKLLTLGVLVFGLLGSVSPETNSIGQVTFLACKPLAERLLPSITEFSIVDLENAQYASLFNGSDTSVSFFESFFPRPTGNNRTEQVPILLNRNTSFLEGDYRVDERLENLNRSISRTSQAFLGSTFRGEDLAALYITENFVSGFWHVNPQNNSANWYFIEPVRPLLLQNVVDPADETAIKNCFGATDKDHIVYEVNETLFTIYLAEPQPSVNAAKAPVSDAQSSLTLQTNAPTNHGVDSEAAHRTVNSFDLAEPVLVGVADKAFVDKYSQLEQKNWFEAMEELFHLVVEFYRVNVGVSLKLQALEGWVRDGGPGSGIVIAEDQTAPNAISLMCDFAQGHPGDRETSHPHASNESALTLVHLVTGHELAPIGPLKEEDVNKVADSGCCFCEDECGPFGRSIVGIAEGLGGIRMSAVSESCADVANDETEPGHHSLSQQVPKLESINADLVDEDLRPQDQNYQANLYQRFLLMAHEIGHNLNASHAEDARLGIMSTPLINGVQFRLDNPDGSIPDSIIQCLDNNRDSPLC